MTTHTKQPISPYLFYAVGGLLAALALLARAIGLDHDARWGASRYILLLLGLALIAIPLLSRAWNSPRFPAALRRSLASLGRDVSGAFCRVAASRSLSLLLAGGVVAVLLFYAFWYTSAGRFPVFPVVKNSYSDLGEAFLHGQVSLLIKPSKELMALPNPYDYHARNQVPYEWDLTYYKGQYYLYWGPVPGLISAALWVLFAGRPVDAAGILLPFAGLGLIYLLLLYDLWRRGFPRAPGLSLALLAGVSLLNLPYLSLLGRPQVYETSIITGVFFLMLGLWAWVRYLLEEKTGWLVLAGLSWGLAAGSRHTLLVTIAIFTLFALAYLWVRRGAGGRVWVGRLAGLLAPLAICGVALLTYNFIRFDNPLETGYTYQLSTPIYENRVFSPVYLPSNLYAYFLNPIGFRDLFPYVSLMPVDATRLPGWANVPAGKLFDPVMFGLLAAFPLILLLPLCLLAPRRAEGIPAKMLPLRWLVWMVGVAWLAQLAAGLLFFSGAMRYMVDFWPTVPVLAAIAIWTVDERLRRWSGLRGLWWLLVAAAAAWIMGLTYFGAFDIPPQVFRHANLGGYNDLKSLWFRRVVAMQNLADSPGLVGAGLRAVMRILR